MAPSPFNLELMWSVTMSQNTTKNRAIYLVGAGLLITVFFLHTLYLKDGVDTITPENHGHHDSSHEIELVVAGMKRHNTSWLDKFFPHWEKSIYIVDDQTAPLKVPMNKGRESMVYLTYMIDNYHDLPPYNFFIHAERFQWHNDDPDYDNIPLLQKFRLSHLDEQGYVNMRCVWAIGCPSEINPFVDEAQDDDEGVTTREIFRHAFEELLPDREVPHTVGVSCCAQFALTREKIQSRPRDDYVRMREWLINAPLDDSLTGRVFEYLWHIIFGLNAVYCPDAGDCYCKLYGMCDLRCDEAGCDGRYTLPPYSTLPEDWPLTGWEGEARNFTGPI